MKYKIRTRFTFRALDRDRELVGEVSGCFEGKLATPVRVPQIGESIPYYFNCYGVRSIMNFKVTDVRHPHDGHTSNPEVYCEAEFVEITIGGEWASTCNRAIGLFDHCAIKDLKEQGLNLIGATRKMAPHFKEEQHDPRSEYRISCTGTRL